MGFNDFQLMKFVEIVWLIIMGYIAIKLFVNFEIAELINMN
jgi:hypothetical protein